MPTAPVIRSVRAGDDLSVEVEGGFVRRHAPADGVVIETPERDLFVAADELMAVLRALGRLPP